jgi:hypothetical protein
MAHAADLLAPGVKRRIADPCRPPSSCHLRSGGQLNLNLPQNPQAILVRIPLPSHAKPSHWHNDSGSVLGGKDSWNYTVRLYRPRAEILDGKWKFPDPKPAS